MMGIKLNRRLLVIFICTILLYDCIYVNLKYEGEYRYIFSLFPPKFHNAVLSQISEIKNPCDYVHTCRVQEKEMLSSCYCDRACTKYNDCCFDATFSNTSEQKTDINIEFSSCESRVITHKHYGIWVVSSCPSGCYPSNITEKCKQAEDIHPVSSADGTTFKNVYCAYCHNVHLYSTWRFEFHYWNKCVEDKLKPFNANIKKKMRYILGNCSSYYTFLPPTNANIRGCVRDVIGEAADGSLCSDFQSPVSLDDQMYRNIHCYNESLPKYITKVCSLVPRGLFESRNYGRKSLTGIFNIRPVLEMFGQKICDENFYYDTIKEACVENSCSNGSQGEEICNAELIRNFGYDLKLKFATDNLIDKDFILRLASVISMSLPRDRYEIALDFVNALYKCGTNTTNNASSCCNGVVEISFFNKIEMTPRETTEFNSNVTNMKWSYLEMRNKTSTSAFDLYENENLIDTCNVTGMRKRRVKRIGPLKAQLNFVHNMTTTWNIVPKEVEGVVIISDGGNSSGPVFRLETLKAWFDTKSDTNDRNPNTTSNYTNYWSVGTIMTYATLGLSCCSLIIAITVYSCLGLFRSTGGIVSKYLMTTMLTAQLFYIVGIGATDNKTFCTIIGIVSHYLWLTSFAWISIFLLSIVKMMKILHTSPGTLVTEHTLPNVVYILGFLLPFVIVLPCALLDILTEVDIGYSEGDICFPTGSLANLFSFTLPVIISLFINIVSLIIASILLSKYNNTIHLLQSVQQERSFIPIYIRLIIFCACPWILGIIADILQVESLSYIFIILAGSHGTFVGISFLLARSVRNRVRFKKQSVEKNSHQQSPE